MKKWLSMLLFAGIGFGLGFFTGKRVGERKKENAKPAEAPKVEYHIDTWDIIEQEHRRLKEEANTIVQKLGYTGDEQSEPITVSKEAVNQYFCQFEHPTEDDDESPSMEEGPNANIDIISYDDYEAETEYEHKSLYFYTEDLVVCDEDEKRIENPEELIGEAALGVLSSQEASAICVRNHWTESVYFVQAIDNAYGRVVLGIEDEYPIN